MVRRATKDFKVFKVSKVKLENPVLKDFKVYKVSKVRSVFKDLKAHKESKASKANEEKLVIKVQMV